MTSRAFDIPARCGPAVLHVVRHAAAHAGLSSYLNCPRCLETPVLDVLKLGTARRTNRKLQLRTHTRASSPFGSLRIPPASCPLRPMPCARPGLWGAWHGALSWLPPGH